jgi:hypothetical protein
LPFALRRLHFPDYCCRMAHYINRRRSFSRHRTPRVGDCCALCGPWQTVNHTPRVAFVDRDAARILRLGIVLDCTRLGIASTLPWLANFPCLRHCHCFLSDVKCFLLRGSSLIIESSSCGGYSLQCRFLSDPGLRTSSLRTLFNTRGSSRGSCGRAPFSWRDFDGEHFR